MAYTCKRILVYQVTYKMWSFGASAPGYVERHTTPPVIAWISRYMNDSHVQTARTCPRFGELVMADRWKPMRRLLCVVQGSFVQTQFGRGLITAEEPVKRNNMYMKQWTAASKIPSL